MRSKALDHEFWIDWCKAIYSQEMAPPATNATNHFYGGLDIVGEHIYFLTASEDPWKYAGKMVAGEGDKKNGVWHIQCNGCAHCVDLHAQDDGDDENLSQARCNVSNTIVEWLKEDAKKRELGITVYDFVDAYPCKVPNPNFIQ